MQADRKFITRLLLLTLPVALQMLMQSALGMVDVIMVSHLGAPALAAVGMATKLHFLLLVLMSGLATSCSVLIAQYLGAKDFPACQRILAVTLWVGIFLMLPFTLAAAFIPHIWAAWINPDPEVAALIATFMRVTAPALLFTQIVTIYEASLRAQGITGVPLIASAISIVVNCLLNYALILGHWGMPALGVEGAAWGTLIARLIQLIFVLVWVYTRHQGFNLSFSQFKQAISGPNIRSFLHFSAPVMANFTLWGIGNTCYHALTGFAGTDALAAMGVMVPIESAFFALFVGLANASAVFVGLALGSDNPAEAWRLHRFFERLTLALLVIFCGGLWLAKVPVMALFAPNDAIAELLTHTIGIFCLLVWVKVINMRRIIGVLRAGGDNRFCLITDFVVMWGIGLPVYAAAILSWHLSFGVLYTLMFFEDMLKFWPVMKRISLGKWARNLTRSTDTRSAVPT